MGGSDSRPNHSQVFKLDDWEPIEWEPYTSIKDPTYSSNFTVYAHKKNPSLQIEKYQLFFNSQAQYISYLETYYERKKFPTLVNSLHIQQTTKKSMCSTFHAASVYLERIHFRLAELIEIPVEQGLYLIEAALEGYEKMFQKTGYFQVSSDMIGINKQGKVKVWVNKNFSKNFPEFNKIDQNKSQQDFIVELLRLIEESIDYPSGSVKFSTYFANKKIPPTFQSVRKTVKQYQKFYKHAPQKSLKSIVLWVKKNNNKQLHASSQILNQLKTSSYSTPNYSEKIMTNSKKSQVTSNIKNIESRKIQIQKGKNKVSKNRPPLQINSYLIPFQNQHHIESFNAQNHQIPGNIKAEAGLRKSGAIHMSFMKQDMFEQQLMQRFQAENNVKGSTKTISKLPSVSFSYKNSGLYSPQNMQSKQSQWFKSNRQQKSEEMGVGTEYRKDFRKSLNNQSHTQQVNKKLNFYSSNGLTQQVDPDIAKDLYSLAKVQK